MKRRFTILTAALALLAFLALPMGMWGQTTETLNIADYADANNWTNATQYSTAQVGDVIFTAAGGGNTGKYYTSGENWRFYQNESATITISVPEGNNLTSITPTFSVTNTGALFNGSTQITSGSAVAVSGTSVTFSVGNSGTASNGQVRFTEIEVTYATGGVILPSITAANVDIAYNATSGNIEYTVSNPVEGATIETAVVTGATIANFALGNETTSPISFTCDANTETTARTATVTLNYVKNGETLATKDVTVTQAALPTTYTTIPALFAAATSTETDVFVTFDSWVVSGVSTNGKNVFVTDNEGHGFVIYSSSDMSSTYSAGKVLAGTAVSCKLKKYNGFAELLNVNASDLTISDGGIVTTSNIDMADLSGVNTGALVHYEGLTCNVTTNSSGTTTYYNLTDGTTTLQVYNSLFAFDALEDGETYNITGIYQQYNNTKEILPRSADDIEEVVSTVPSITVDPDEVNVDAEEHDGTLDLTYENLTITEMSDFDIQFCDANGDELSEEPDWIEVLVAEQDPQIGEGYVVSYYMVENEGEARTAYFKVFALGDEDFVYSNLVTVNQAAPVVPPTPGTWVLTSLADLTEDDIFVIVGTDSDTEATYALPNDGGSSAPVATEITIVEGTISGEPATNLQWNLSGNTNDGYTFYPNGDAESWLYCSTTAASGSNNNIKVGTGDRKLFVLDENGYLVTNDDKVDRYLSIYFNSGVAQDWRGYINTNSAVAISFYKKVEAATETYTLDITGYTAGNTGGYYLIASPVNVNPANVEGMTEGTFDLYYFDQAEEDEWRNFEAQTFNLVPGKGYLYAKQATTEGEIFHFTLTGTPYSGDGMIELDYTEGGDFPGWNLVGNPFGVEAEISSDFYVMNEGGTEIIAGESELVEPMQGVFVIAENDDDYVIFEPAVAPGPGNEKLVMNVRRERGNVIDRAIVRFGEGRQLPKFQLNANSTKLYIVEGENEYAVVRSANEGEMPVSFKAAENGTYTLSVNAENMEMNYLHLIDNMTKADVDLLANPNYTFEANTTDLATRFTLVFAATGMNENTTQSFAFFNGSEWVISNMGEATLQVVDVMGRIVSSETINGNTSVSLNQTSGVYMLRLVNGDNVKVQKVVVR